MAHACHICGTISTTPHCPQHPAPAKHKRISGRRLQAMRAQTLETHGPKCHLCALPIQKDQRWHLDHIIPLSQGGTDHPTNLAPAHTTCNLAKGPHEPRKQTT